MGHAFVYQDIWQRCQEPPDVMQETACGDKELPCLRLPAEPEAFLGRRGVRLLLSYPELLQTQLRALLRLAERHDLRILVPRVTLAEEMQQMRGLLQQAAGDVGAQRLPPLGAMIETTAAVGCGFTAAGGLPLRFHQVMCAGLPGLALP